MLFTSTACLPLASNFAIVSRRKANLVIFNSSFVISSVMWLSSGKKEIILKESEECDVHGTNSLELYIRNLTVAAALSLFSLFMLPCYLRTLLKLDEFSAYARLRRKMQMEEFGGESWLKNFERQSVTGGKLYSGPIRGCVCVWTWAGRNSVRLFRLCVTFDIVFV